jgi:hypothetical protein
MYVDQKHITTVDLRDGKTRDFVLLRDDRGCKLTVIAHDDVLNLLFAPHDLNRLQQELGRPDQKTATRGYYTSGEDIAPRPSRIAQIAGTAVRVDRRHVTTVSLHSVDVHEYVLRRDEHGYKLSAVSTEDIVNVLLTALDLFKLRQELLKHDVAVPDEAQQPPLKECITASPPSEASSYQPGTLDWLAYN